MTDPLANATARLKASTKRTILAALRRHARRAMTSPSRITIEPREQREHPRS